MRTTSHTPQAEGWLAARMAPAGRCRALVVTYIDYRFVEPLRDVLVDHGLNGAYDLLAWPGGAVALTSPDRASLTEAIALACEVHDPLEMILVAHHDCPRLAGSACFPGREDEIAALETALALAGADLAERYSQLHVRLIRLGMDGACSIGTVSPAHMSGGSVR